MLFTGAKLYLVYIILHVSFFFLNSYWLVIMTKLYLVNICEKITFGECAVQNKSHLPTKRLSLLIRNLWLVCYQHGGSSPFGGGNRNILFSASARRQNHSETTDKQIMILIMRLYLEQVQYVSNQRLDHQIFYRLA